MAVGLRTKALAHEVFWTGAPWLILTRAEPAFFLKEVEEYDLTEEFLGKASDQMILFFIAFALKPWFSLQVLAELLKEGFVLFKELVGDLLDAKCGFDLFYARVGVVHGEHG